MNDGTLDEGRTSPMSPGTDANGSPTKAFDQSLGRFDSGSGRLEVRCPNCHAPSEVAVDTALTDLTCPSCGSHFSLVDQSQATRIAPSLSKLGRFELIERIGVGGYGSVWKARDKELDRTVAIKIPRAGGMTAEEQEKFFREARAAAQLRHPNIVSVHEVGRDGESVYIVSDFVRGVTLSDWLTGQQLTNREAAEVCVTIADALEHAHEQGVVHRDLKPANIMMDYDGRPHLMDFGLARRETGEVTMTIDGQVLGTPAYMSPEQAQGEAHTADRRSDIYSLGVILFQLLTGERPFRGNARMLIKQVIQDEPPSPRKLNANIHRDLETITLKCLEKDPARRYQSAKELSDELRRFLTGNPIHSRPVGRVEQTWRWCQRNPTLAALSTALLVTLVAISTIAPIITARQVSLRRDAQAAEAEATREAATAKRLADVEGAKYALTQGRIAEAYQQITSAVKNQPALEYGRILDQIIDEARSHWQLIGRIPTDKTPDWGSFVGSGPKWLVLSRGGKVEARSVPRDEVLATITLPGGGYAPRAIGPDTIAIAAKSGGIGLYSLPNLQSTASCDFPERVLEIRSVADGSVFVALGDRGMSRVFDRTGNALASTRFDFVDKVEVSHPSVDISPSGKLVLYHPGRKGESQIWKWQSDESRSFVCPTFISRFGSDETLYGIRTSARNASLSQTDVKSAETRALNLHEEEPFLYTDSALFEGVGDGKDRLSLASICEEAIHIFSDVRPRGENSPKLELEITRYHSLWPQAPVHPEFLAYDSRTATLALATDKDVVLFTRRLPRQPGSDFSTSLETLWRNLAQAGDTIFTLKGDIVYSLSLKTLEKHKYRVRGPRPADQRYMAFEQLAVTADGKVLALTCHERVLTTNGPGRYLVQTWRLPPVGAGDSVELIHEVELKELSNRSTRESGRIVISPDGSVVATYSAYGTFAGYRTSDGARVFNHKIAESTTFASCSDPPLVAVCDYARPSPIPIYDAATGKLISQVETETPGGKVALSCDGKFLYVGWPKRRVLGKYRVSDGSLVSEINSPILPVAISPSERRFVGFYPDAPRIGSLILGQLNTAKVVEHISDDAYIIENACFSPEEDKIVYTREGNCAIMKTPEISEAESRLQRSAIDPELAAASTDLADYRERLAGRDENEAAATKRTGLVNSRKFVRDALAIWEDLYADFPKSRKYADTVANRHESIAADDEIYRISNTYVVDSASSNRVAPIYDWASTREHLETALAVRKQMAADFPDVAEYKTAIAESQKRLDDFDTRHKLKGTH